MTVESEDGDDDERGGGRWRPCDFLDDSPTAPVALFPLIGAGFFVTIAVLLIIGESLRRHRALARKRRR